MSQTDRDPRIDPRPGDQWRWGGFLLRVHSIDPCPAIKGGAWMCIERASTFTKRPRWKKWALPIGHWPQFIDDLGWRLIHAAD